MTTRQYCLVVFAQKLSSCCFRTIHGIHSGCFGSLYLSLRTMMAQAIRAILLARATTATFCVSAAPCPGQRGALEALDARPEPDIRGRCVLGLDAADSLQRPRKGHAAPLEEQLPGEQRAVQLSLREDALAQRSARKAIIVSPTAFRLCGDTAVRLSQRRCQQSKSKSIRSITGTPARTKGTWSSSTAPCSRAREMAREAGAPRRRPQPSPEPAVRELIARDCELLVAHEVEDDR